MSKTITKEFKIFTGVALIIIGATIVILTYARKKMLKDTFEYYEKQEKEPKIMN